YDDLSAIEAVPDVVLVAPEPGEPNEATQHTLELLQAWLGDERFADARLAVVTHGALAVRDGEVPDLCSAPLVGLLRSAHSEHPDRFLLLDVDGTEESWQAIAGVAGADEP